MNLLDNWDFRGANPDLSLNTVVNQRGLVEYLAHSSNYTIDRWRSHSSQAAVHVRILNGGIIITRPQNVTAAVFSQRLEFWERLRGGTYTMSAMVDGEVHSFVVEIPHVHPGERFSSQTSPAFAEHWHLTLINNPANTLRFEIQAPSGAAIETTLVLQAVKLELGDKSTLLNDPPMNFNLELLKCQRYQRVYSTNNVNTQGQTAPPMRITPVVTRLAANRYLYDANL